MTRSSLRSAIHHLGFRRVRNERGVTLVILAVSSVAIVGMVGLVMDGGAAFAERRQMQNAADTSALGGARMMDLHRQGDATAADILTEVETLAFENGADLAELGCDYVDIAGNDLGDCGDTVPAAASGIRVATEQTKDTAFVRIFGYDNFTAAADATAQVLAVRQINPGDVPFLVCGYDPDSPGDGLVLWDEGLQDWVLNDDLVGGPWFTINGPQVDDCGAGSSAFKGWADDTYPGELDSWWGTRTGKRDGPARAVLADALACESSDLEDCTVVVPVCIEGVGQGASVELLCVEFAAFLVRNSFANRYDAQLYDTTPRVLNGSAGGPAQPTGARIIQLTE